MIVLQVVFQIILGLTSLLLTLLILLHKGRGGGLSDMFGGGVTSNLGASGVAERNLNRITVLLDAETDRLQVIVDEAVVLDETDTDFDLSGTLDDGWYLGAGDAAPAATDAAVVEVTDFRLDDDFLFLPQQHEMLLAI